MNLIFLEQYSPTSTHLFCLLSFASFFHLLYKEMERIDTYYPLKPSLLESIAKLSLGFWNGNFNKRYIVTTYTKNPKESSIL